MRLKGGSILRVPPKTVLAQLKKFGFDNGKELNLYKSNFLDGCPMVSGTKKSFGSVPQIFCY